MSCKATRQRMKDFIIDNEDLYQDAKRQAFLKHIIDETKSYMDSTDIELWSIMDLGESILGEDFKFPDEIDYLSTEYENQLADCADAQRDAERDKSWEDLND